MVQTEIINILKNYLNLVKAEGISVDKAFLYGSYLNNAQTEESDIDLMVVTRNLCDDNTAGKIWSLTRTVNSKIEPYIIDKNRFENDNSSPLIDFVKKKGLEIL